MSSIFSSAFATYCFIRSNRDEEEDRFIDEADFEELEELSSL